MSHSDKSKISARLKKLEGQIRGISKMIDDDRYCVDILNQTAAARAALKGVEKAIIENHSNHCIEEAIRSGDQEDQRRKFRELVNIIGKTSS